MATQQPLAVSSTRTEELRALYYSYIKACNAHDFETIKTYYASSININDEPWVPSKVIAQFTPLVKAFPDWHWEIRNLNIDGDYLSLHLRVTGTHQGIFQGIEPTGKRMTTSEFTLYHLVDGKFAEIWDLVDWATVMKQIQGTEVAV